MLQVIPHRIHEIQVQIRQMDEATQYHMAKESARQVGRTDEAFIQELMREARGD